MKKLHLLAFDLGASNGRAMLGEFDGERLELQQLHRFENAPVAEGGAHYWNAPLLLDSLKQGFAACKRETGAGPDAFGIDTWGVDYGLLNSAGAPLGSPRCYRDATDEEMLAAWQIVGKRELFERTGIAAMNFNTIYQLYRRVRENDPALQAAETLLLLPDLLGFYLTGEKRSEYTNATTTNLLSVKTGDWDFDVIRRLGIPERLFTPIDRAGTLRGRLKKSVAEELCVPRAPFAAVGTHDTASAVSAIPGEGKFAFCSCGTWSLFGTETDRPLIDDEVFAANFSNEGTVQGGYRPLKNIMGLWILQECRREWSRQGTVYPWDDLCDLAEQETPFASIIDPDDAPFFAAGDMCHKIVRYCEKTGQRVPQTAGQFTRCVFESLALKYRWALERLERMQGAAFDTLNMTGGGISNLILCRMTANATGKRVVAGPSEGSAMGNALQQAVALGEIKDLAEARAVVARSVSPKEYLPDSDRAVWQEAYGRLLSYMPAK